jgi:hypothetical protein
MACAGTPTDSPPRRPRAARAEPASLAFTIYTPDPSGFPHDPSDIARADTDAYGAPFDVCGPLDPVRLGDGLTRPERQVRASNGPEMAPALHRAAYRLTPSQLVPAGDRSCCQLSSHRGNSLQRRPLSTRETRVQVPPLIRPTGVVQMRPVYRSVPGKPPTRSSDVASIDDSRLVLRGTCRQASG